MLVSNPMREIERKYDYYFVSRFGRLSLFQSQEKLEVGSLVYLSAVGDYLYRVTEITEREDKTIVTFDSPKVIICDQPDPFRSL